MRSFHDARAVQALTAAFESADTFGPDTGTLIRCYFEHMHFFFPVLDVETFFRDALKGEDRCWLLYWAVMLAGANVSRPSPVLIPVCSSG